MLVRTAFAVWATVVVVVSAYLLSSHLLTLPAPSAGDVGLQRAIAAQRRPEQRGRWLVVHVLDADCKCSLRVLEHLLEGNRPVGVAERVVLVAATPDAEQVRAIRAHGFDLDVVTPEQLGDRYQVGAAPLLIITDPRDRVHYVGGYGPRKQSAALRDAAVITAVLAGASVDPLPTFGCAIGRSLQTKIDPLGLRGWK